MRIVTLGLSALVIATAPISAAQSEAAPRKLTTTEIRKLLPGLYVQEVVPDGLQDLSTPEMFNKSGNYIRYADNHEIDGRYAIERGLVCVNDELHRKYCRFILVDVRGQYYFQSAARPTAMLVPIRMIPQR
jgi:hypothetical protein